MSTTRPSGITDDWIIYGDSITMMTFVTNCIGPLVHAKLPAYNPIWEGGGLGFMTARDGTAKLLPKWLPLFPGKYVCLAYGTNDANLGRLANEGDATGFYDNYESMVKQILAANKVPVIGTVIWAKDDGFRQKNLERYNAQLQRLKAKYPQIRQRPRPLRQVQRPPRVVPGCLAPEPRGQRHPPPRVGTVGAGHRIPGRREIVAC